MAGGKGFFTDTTLCIGCKARDARASFYQQRADRGAAEVAGSRSL